MKRIMTVLAGAGMMMALAACGGNSENGEKGNKNGGADAACAIEAIMTRTSVRAYTADTVSDADVETLLRAAMAAPTAVNKQPWRFVVINDRAILKHLGDSIGSMRMAAGAPLAIAVCGNLDEALEGEMREFWVQDCSAATENLLVAANALGLGAVWCGVYPRQAIVATVRETLGLPDNIVPLCVVPIGHPDGDFQPKDKWKPSNIVYNHWNEN